MKPGDRYEMNWSSGRSRRSVLLVCSVRDDDTVVMKKWIKSKQAWTHDGMPMAKLTVTSGRKMEPDEANP